MDLIHKTRKTILPAILLFLTIFVLIKGLFWLVIPLLLAVLLWVLFNTTNKINYWFRKKKWISYIISFLLIFLLAIAIRVFLIEIYNVPSDSMENSILPGDVVLVNKLCYGPRLPASPFEIPWLNIFYSLNENTRQKMDSVCWIYKRFRGFSEAKHNDIIVFNTPDTLDMILIKRCVALPGDTLQLKKSEVFINGVKQPSFQTVICNYRITCNDYTQAKRLMDSLNILASPPFGNREEISITINKHQKNLLLDSPYIKTLTLENKRADTTLFVYPWHAKFPWTIYNFGPVVIPAKGMKINLNDSTVALYGKLIRDENNEIRKNEGNYYLNGEKISTYIFKYDSYMMMGDNRTNSIDSRYWGFVSEYRIIGKAVNVLFSTNRNGFNWKRLLKRLE